MKAPSKDMMNSLSKSILTLASYDDSMYIHRPDPSLSTAENLLRMLRPDMKYTELEARVLDLALVLHMEHGGANIKVVEMMEDLKRNVKDTKDEEEVEAL